MVLSYAGPASQNSPFTGIDFNYSSRGNYTWWSDPQFDAMADKARATFNEQERNQILKSAFEYVADQAPGIWLEIIQTPVAHNTNVTMLLITFVLWATGV